MKIAQYEWLEEWARKHKVTFRVDWYPDCHILSAWHYHEHNDLVSWSYVKYPHKGGFYDLRPWGADDTLKEFVGLFGAKGRPMQPTPEIGYVRETA